MPSKRIRNSGFSASSQRWMQRHITDPYVAMARKEGYRSRAAYKLLEMQLKFNLLKPGDCVLDLGAAPGSWSQVASNVVGRSGKVVALDLLPMKALNGVSFYQGDITTSETMALIEAIGAFSLLLSDMSPNTTGFKKVDHIRSIELCSLVAELSCRLLSKGGSAVMKLLNGGDQAGLLKSLKPSFQRTKLYKPSASRAESREIYLVAMCRI